MRDWLLEARKNVGLTQRQVSEKIGVSEAYYSYIENGERQKKMDITMCFKLAEVLGMTVQEVADKENAVCTE